MADSNITDLLSLNKCIADFREKELTLSPEITLFEIAGFPSRENVFSNVLKFYFDSRERHQFGTSVLKFFLSDIVSNKDDNDLQTISINREVTTNKQNRIDLVIETNKYLIGIENKVFHSVNNDLSDYATFLKARTSKELILIVLNLHKDNLANDENGFKYISYKKLLDNLSLLVETATASKYHLLLKDFIQNIRNHFPSIMTEEQIKFLEANEEAIEKIKMLSGKATNYLHLRIAEIFKAIKPPDESWYPYNEVPWSFELHKGIQNLTLKIACTIEISKIYIEIGCDESHMFNKLRNWLNKHFNKEISLQNGWLYMKQYNEIYNVSNKEITAELQKLVLLIEDFTKENTI